MAHWNSRTGRRVKGTDIVDGSLEGSDLRSAVAGAGLGLSAGVLSVDGYTDAASGTAARIKLLEDTDNGTDGVTLAAPSSMSADATVTVPEANGKTLAVMANNDFDGAEVANVADANVIGGIPVVHRIAIPAAAGDTDVTLTHKTLVTDIVLVKTVQAGLASGTILVKNGASPIQTAVAWDNTTADESVTRMTVYKDDNAEIAAAGTLRITTSQAQSDGIAYVTGLRIA